MMQLQILNNILLYSTKYPNCLFFLKNNDIVYLKKNSPCEETNVFKGDVTLLRIADEKLTRETNLKGFDFKFVERCDIHSTVAKYIRNHPFKD